MNAIIQRVLYAALRQADGAYIDQGAELLRTVKINAATVSAGVRTAPSDMRSSWVGRLPWSRPQSWRLLSTTRRTLWSIS